MQITKWHWIVVGIACLVAIGSYYAWQNRQLPNPLPIVSGDVISSWTWKGPYKDGGLLEKKANDEITRLGAMLGKGQYPDYQLLVGIAGQYELLGDGDKTYSYLGQAVRTASTSGLAWYNLGVLFERYGAYRTAITAFNKALEVEPTSLFKEGVDDFYKNHPNVTATSTP